MGQTIKEFKIIDAEDHRQLFNAKVVNTSNGDTLYSDRNGNFIIDYEDPFTISYPGYFSINIDPNIFDSRIILLESILQTLDEVLVNTNNIPVNFKRTSQSINHVTQADLNLQSSHELSSILNIVPGVFMQSGTLNTNRITIRGIGARNLFGTANIRAYYEDIPLTDGNGESSIEDLELGSLSGISIVKGPSASSFGVGLGGTIILKPKLGFFNSNTINTSYTFGSFGFQKFLAKTEVKLKNLGFNIIYSDTQSDGYRANNLYNRKTFTATSKAFLGLKDELIFIGSFIDLKGGIPSSLSQTDFEEFPKKAAFTWGKSAAYEDLQYGIFGLSWKHDFSNALSHITSLNTSLRKNYEPRPFNILKENSQSFGLRSRLLANKTLNEIEFDFSLGGELFYDFYNNQFFENLYEDFDDDRGSVEGSQILGYKEQRNYFNLFAETKIKLNDAMILDVGVNLNNTFFNVKDEYNVNELDNNGEFNFKPILSPKIGYNYRISESLISFGNISHGFSTPTTSETLLPDGVFNSDLKPEIGWNFEAGLRLNLLENKLRGSLSLYKMLISDLLVSRRTQQDDFFAINAGNSVYNGIEAQLKYRLLDNVNYKIEIEFGLSLHDYKFDEFIDLDNDFSGNKITGVPSHVGNIQIKLISEANFYGRIAYQSVGKMAVNDSNSVFSNAYQLLNSKVGYKIELPMGLEIDLHCSLNNILDEKYASQIQINAIGFGNNDPRYFYPGLPFNYYIGTNVSYRFK